MYPSIDQYKNALNMIGNSIENEKSDAIFYDWLLQNIPRNTISPSEAYAIEQTIKEIRNDELSHNQTFKKLYQQLTGKEPSIPSEEKFIPPASFNEGIITALSGELNAVKRYREIMAGMPNNYYRDQLFNILTDELRHGSLYNSIYTTITK